ncbi:hypothetical protein Tco_0443916, partial [Tanacetum coccineum]
MGKWSRAPRQPLVPLTRVSLLWAWFGPVEPYVQPDKQPIRPVWLAMQSGNQVGPESVRLGYHKGPVGQLGQAWE